MPVLTRAMAKKAKMLDSKHEDGNPNAVIIPSTTPSYTSISTSIPTTPKPDEERPKNTEIDPKNGDGDENAPTALESMTITTIAEPEELPQPPPPVLESSLKSIKEVSSSSETFEMATSTSTADETAEEELPPPLLQSPLKNIKDVSSSSETLEMTTSTSTADETAEEELSQPPPLRQSPLKNIKDVSSSSETLEMTTSTSTADETAEEELSQPPPLRQSPLKNIKDVSSSSSETLEMTTSTSTADETAEEELPPPPPLLQSPLKNIKDVSSSSETLEMTANTTIAETADEELIPQLQPPVPSKSPLKNVEKDDFIATPRNAQKTKKPLINLELDLIPVPEIEEDTIKSLTKVALNKKYPKCVEIAIEKFVHAGSTAPLLLSKINEEEAETPCTLKMPVGRKINFDAIPECDLIESDEDEESYIYKPTSTSGTPASASNSKTFSFSDSEHEADVETKEISTYAITPYNLVLRENGENLDKYLEYQKDKMICSWSHGEGLVSTLVSHVTVHGYGHDLTPFPENSKEVLFPNAMESPDENGDYFYGSKEATVGVRDRNGRIISIPFKNETNGELILKDQHQLNTTVTLGPFKSEDRNRELLKDQSNTTITLE